MCKMKSEESSKQEITHKAEETLINGAKECSKK